MNTTSTGAFMVDDSPLAEVVGKAAGNFSLPIAILCASFIIVTYVPDPPEYFLAIKIYAPFFTLGMGLLISLAFKRGRAFFAVLSLLIAYACFSAFFAASEPLAFDTRTIYAALCILVPVNLAFLALVHERGALNAYGARRLAAIGLAIGLVIAVIHGDYQSVTAGLYQPLVTGLVTGSALPQSAVAVMALSLLVALVVAVARASVIEASLAVSIAAFAAACSVVGTPDVYIWFTAGGVIMTVAVLQDSHRMAFRDELTGLPGRRALNESLMALDRNYTIAMVDVDHFKAFNDKWGHDVGDQVLKLVASRIQRVGGGGKAYRYGGEEFTIVFPGKRLLEVLARLDALRRNIEGYKLRLRAKDRPGEDATRNPGVVPSNWISVTVSAGVAERNERLPTPDDVLQAADQALYRAKHAGRNRVSR